MWWFDVNSNNYYQLLFFVSVNVSHRENLVWGVYSVPKPEKSESPLPLFSPLNGTFATCNTSHSNHHRVFASREKQLEAVTKIILSINDLPQVALGRDPIRPTPGCFVKEGRILKVEACQPVCSSWQGGVQLLSEMKRKGIHPLIVK